MYSDKFFNYYFIKLLTFTTKATNEVVTMVPQATQAEMMAAVASSKKAFKTWKNTSILQRQQMMFKYQQIIKDNMVN